MNEGFLRRKMIAIYIIISMVLIYSVTCLILIASGMKESKDIPQGTPAIVLGCRVVGDEPCPMLVRRCKRAEEYLKECDEAVAILSGGKGGDEGISEAQAMFDYLTRAGISPDRLILEDKSATTQENMRFSKRILDEKQMGDTAVIITTGFHQFRSRILAAREGIRTYSLCSSLSAASMVKNVLREIIVMPSLFRK